MNLSEKEFVKWLKLDHGLQYQDGDFIHTEPLVDDGQLNIESYTKIFIYEPTEEKQISTWDIVSEKIITLENEKQVLPEKESSCGYLPQTHLKLLIPVFKITYIGNPLESIKRSNRIELCQQFLSETVLVGGGLIIKNVSDFKNESRFDILKAHIIWIIDEI
ncbi:3758_t:CDS:2, partial [Racocetra fulgida]